MAGDIVTVKRGCEMGEAIDGVGGSVEILGVDETHGLTNHIVRKTDALRQLRLPTCPTSGDRIGERELDVGTSETVIGPHLLLGVGFIVIDILRIVGHRPPREAEPRRRSPIL